jgi:hypothetical protein
MSFSFLRCPVAKVTTWPRLSGFPPFSDATDWDFANRQSSLEEHPLQQYLDTAVSSTSLHGHGFELRCPSQCGVCYCG